MYKTLLRLFKNSNFRLLLRLIVTILLLFLAFRVINLNRLLTTFSHVNPEYLIYAIILGIVANVIGGLAWRLLLSVLGIKLGIKEFTRTYVIGLFFALFTPGGLGSDAIRTYELKRMTGKGLFGFGSILVSRILSLLALLLLGLIVSVILQPDLQSTKIIIFIFSIYLLLLTILVLAILYWRRRKQSLKPSTNQMLKQIYELVATFIQKPGAIFTSTGLYIIHHLVVVIAICVGALAFNINVPIKSLLALVPLARAAALLPISINGFGIQESVVLLLMSQISVSPEVAITISLLGHLVLVPVPLSGGIVFLLSRYSRVRSKAGFDQSEKAMRMKLEKQK